MRAMNILNLLYRIYLTSGINEATLLGDIFRAHQLSTVCFKEPSPALTVRRKISCNMREPGTPGQDVVVYEICEGQPWYQVAVHSRQSLEAGKNSPNFNVYLRSPELARRLASALHKGYLNLNQLQPQFEEPAGCLTTLSI